mgnify:CR=1 FL=1
MRTRPDATPKQRVALVALRENHVAFVIRAFRGERCDAIERGVRQAAKEIVVLEHRFGAQLRSRRRAVVAVGHLAHAGFPDIGGSRSRRRGVWPLLFGLSIVYPRGNAKR